MCHIVWRKYRDRLNLHSSCYRSELGFPSFYQDVEDYKKCRQSSVSPSLQFSNAGEAWASPSLMAPPPMTDSLNADLFFESIEHTVKISTARRKRNIYWMFQEVCNTFRHEWMIKSWLFLKKMHREKLCKKILIGVFWWLFPWLKWISYMIVLTFQCMNNLIILFLKDTWSKVLPKLYKQIANEKQNSLRNSFIIRDMMVSISHYHVGSFGTWNKLSEQVNSDLFM